MRHKGLHGFDGEVPVYTFEGFMKKEIYKHGMPRGIPTSWDSIPQLIDFIERGSRLSLKDKIRPGLGDTPGYERLEDTQDQ